MNFKVYIQHWFIWFFIGEEGIKSNLVYTEFFSLQSTNIFQLRCILGQKFHDHSSFSEIQF